MPHHLRLDGVVLWRPLAARLFPAVQPGQRQQLPLPVRFTGGSAGLDQPPERSGQRLPSAGTRPDKPRRGWNFVTLTNELHHPTSVVVVVIIIFQNHCEINHKFVKREKSNAISPRTNVSLQQFFDCLQKCKLEMGQFIAAAPQYQHFISQNFLPSYINSSSLAYLFMFYFWLWQNW